MIKRYKVTIVCLAPWQTYELFNHPLATQEVFSTVRCAFITGGWISAQVLQRSQSLLTCGMIVFSYGATEIGAITANIDHSQNNNENNVGRLFPGVRVKIIDDEGNNLPHNKIGEVLMSTGSKWMGYVGNPVDTDATLQNGWINLGDLGYFDDDNNLFSCGSQKGFAQIQVMSLLAH